MSEAGRKKRAGKHVKHPHKSPHESRQARLERRRRLLDDDYDARSGASYEYSEADAQTEAADDARWGPGGAESPREGTEA